MARWSVLAFASTALNRARRRAEPQQQPNSARQKRSEPLLSPSDTGPCTADVSRARRPLTERRDSASPVRKAEGTEFGAEDGAAQDAAGTAIESSLTSSSSGSRLESTPVRTGKTRAWWRDFDGVAENVGTMLLREGECDPTAALRR